MRLIDLCRSTAFFSDLLVAFLAFPEVPSPISITSESDPKLRRRDERSARCVRVAYNPFEEDVRARLRLFDRPVMHQLPLSLRSGCWSTSLSAASSSASVLAVVIRFQPLLVEGRKVLVRVANDLNRRALSWALGHRSSCRNAQNRGEGGERRVSSSSPSLPSLSLQLTLSLPLRL